MFILLRPIIARGILALICLLTLAVATPAVTKPAFAAPRATGDYGSITYSTSLNLYFWDYGGSKDAALNNAWNRCVQKGNQAGSTFQDDCDSAVWVHNGYMSIARGSNGIWGTGYGTSKEFADDYANRICKNHGGTNCHILGTYRTNNIQNSPEGGPGFGIRTSGSRVTLERVFTTNGVGDVGKEAEATYFFAGDNIRYVAQVRNQGNTKATPTLYFEATGPQSILSWKRTASLDHPGMWYVYLNRAVPTNARGGQYTFRVTMTYNGQSSAKESQFNNMVLYNSGYAGYAITDVVGKSATYYNVRGSWTQPTAQCSPGENSGAAFWVGLGGLDPSSPNFQSNALEQTGTTAECFEGKVRYRAWWQNIYLKNAPGTGPHFLDPKQYPINPGDSIYAEVWYRGNGLFRFTLIDTAWKKPFEETRLGNPTYRGRSAALWIVEVPGLEQCKECSLTRFVTSGQPLVNFSGCIADGNMLTVGPRIMKIHMTDKGSPKGIMKAYPLHPTSNDTAFSVQWKNP